jgi:hypothetical protein
MPPHDRSHPRPHRPCPRTRFPSVPARRDPSTHQTGALGLFPELPVFSICLMSRMLPCESSSPEGPERPSFSNAAFLANSPANRASIHPFPSSLHPLRSLRLGAFALPSLSFPSPRPLRSLRFLLSFLGSRQNGWRARRACGTLHQKNPASQRVATAARVNHGGRYAKLE